VRIHDLRHTFASTAVATDQGLQMIGKLLRHAQVQTTARYAHLAADPIKDAADQIAGESGSTRTPIPAQGGQQSGDCGQQVMAG
jgi:integrase